MIYPDIETKTETVSHWLNNLRKGLSNQEVLIICIKGKIDKKFEDKLKRDIEEILFKNEKNETEFYIDKLSTWIDNPQVRIRTKNKNIILLANNYNISISHIKKLQTKVLIVNFPFQHFETIPMLLANVQDTSIDTNDNKFFSFYMEKKNPMEILNKDASIIRQFLDNTPCVKDGSISNFLKNTNLLTSLDDLIDTSAKPFKKLSTNNSLQEEYILRDITSLKETGILTSRLSIAIYRKANLDTDISVTEVGRYFSSKHNKSKVVDLIKLSRDTSTNYDGLSKTKVKGYDLNTKVKGEKELRKELELEIKEHIAKKLLYFTEMDIDTIQRIVELPKSTLKNYR